MKVQNNLFNENNKINIYNNINNKKLICMGKRSENLMSFILIRDYDAFVFYSVKA